MRTGEAPPSGVEGLAGAVAEIMGSIFFEIRKLALVLSLSLLLLALNLIPGLGSVVATIGGIVLGSLVACLDFLGPALERWKLGLRGQIGFIGRGLPGTAGLGLVCFGLVSIPFLNLLLIPVCVTAGSLYFADRLRSRFPDEEAPPEEEAEPAAQPDGSEPDVGVGATRRGRRTPPIGPDPADRPIAG